ncbi:ABC1 kinase family protein [Methylobacterium nonmethylotrophicum]|uniref:AarF/ABC1/UbiB kinase family protein n=1 Tax=Methylobacterium nonmethylotrophicum TaxID=1141884 RepID=A0A4Z0NPT0_9HYPH|nr:AarF/UbiB family protein [Methylobacterium nonmethylotrophicum]TGD98914.1 AarF/ABC1/UbiB kinase family protein [Methylobacterium nonmethylotrophicum]
MEEADRVERAVGAALRRWPGPVDIAPEYRPRAQGPAEPEGVVRSLPRRVVTHKASDSHVALPMAKVLVHRPGLLRPAQRLLVWAGATGRFFLGNAVDALRGRNTVERRAERLRRVFEDTGATFAKVGQQLSLRADLLPYAYCVELSKMLDQAKAIPTEVAIAVVERSLGRPLAEVFEAFDPEPIGAASIACVYQAVLRTGERVAVKVKRPQIGETLAADLRALDWLLIGAETLTLIRPGFTARFRQELRKMLLAELDFRAEARYTDIFRRRAKKDGNTVTAPRVYFDHSTEDVLVTELMSGVWMWELMAAVDAKDAPFLAALQARGIEPKAVAQNLIRTVHRELLEELFFHGDPHPANLVVLPGNRICFLDFGAIGRFSTQTRNMWRELHYHMRNRDVARMVASTVNLSGPLPPIDVERVMKSVEGIYADWVYAISSKDAEWWERSTSQTWLRYISLARDNGLPVSLETIQFFRSTVLYDSIITRLDKDIDFDEAWKAHTRRAAKKARRRVRRAMAKRIYGPTRMDYLRIEQAADMATQAFFRYQQEIEQPLIRFRNIVGKIAYTMNVLLKLAVVLAVVTAGWLVMPVGLHRWLGIEIDGGRLVEAATSVGWPQAALLALGVLLIRRILFRINDPDTKPD